MDIWILQSNLTNPIIKSELDVLDTSFLVGRVLNWLYKILALHISTKYSASYEVVE